MNKSKRELIEDQINSGLKDPLNINVGDVYNCLLMYSNSFPRFKLKVELKKKNLSQPCEGYCKNSGRKYKKNELLSFPDHDHKFCYYCVTKWIETSFYKNPNNEIKCQKCTELGKEGPVFYDDFICNTLASTIEQVNHFRANFRDPQFYICCACCGSECLKTELTLFLCSHSLCPNCTNILLINTLDYFYGLINNRSVDLKDLVFYVSCNCGIEVSSKNELWKNILNRVQNIQIPNINDYINFIQCYPNFFNRTAALIRCKKCPAVAEALQAIMTCKSCSSCMACGEFSHPGNNCDEMRNLIANGKYMITNPNQPMLPQPPEGDANIVALYAKMITKIEMCFNIPRKVAKIWNVTNPYQEYLFNFAKQKDYIFSDLYDDTEYQGILQNNFPSDAKCLIRFPEKLNSRPEKKYVFYLEIMYDECLNQDPDTVDENKKCSKLLLIKNLNHYCFNSVRSIRIIFLIELL